jgi:hypothetical protein
MMVQKQHTLREINVYNKYNLYVIVPSATVIIITAAAVTEFVTDRAKVLKCPKTNTCSNGINIPNHTKPMAVCYSCAPDDRCK